MSWRIWAWVVTSSAVVGSSAISSAGFMASAMAMTTRWHWPPENLVRIARRDRLRVGQVHGGEQLQHAPPPLLAAHLGRMELEHLLDLAADGMAGLSDAIGSWKIIATCARRAARAGGTRRRS